MVVFSQPEDHFRKVYWKKPFFFAIALHLLVFCLSIYTPDFFRAKPNFAEVHTVNLVNFQAPPPPQETKAEQPPPVAESPKVPPSKKQAPIAAQQQPEPVIPDSAPPKEISLNPKKRKIKKNITKPKDLAARNNREKVRQKAKQLARQLQQEALLEQQARLAAEKARLAQQALEEERKLLRDSTKLLPVPGPLTPRNQSGPTTGQLTANSSSIIESQYFATVVGIIQSHWAIPPNLGKRNDLQAIVIVIVNRDGRIVDMYMEKKSGNKIFDQFVEKSIDASNPLPPIPPAMNRQKIEFGLNFSPRGVQ